MVEAVLPAQVAKGHPAAPYPDPEVAGARLAAPRTRTAALAALEGPLAPTSEVTLKDHKSSAAQSVLRLVTTLAAAAPREQVQAMPTPVRITAALPPTVGARVPRPAKLRAGAPRAGGTAML